MYKKFLSTLSIAALISTSAFAGDVVTIHGSTTVDSNLFKPHMAEIEKLTGLKFNVIANGSSRGLKGIDSGAADIGMISSDLSSVLRKLKLTDRASEFHSETIGEERIVFAVHPSNAVNELSKEQVVSILNGETKNWAEVGGKSSPIIVVTEYAGGGFRTTVEKKLLSKAEISAATLKELPNGSQVVKVGQQIKPSFVVVPSTMLAGSSLKKITTDAEIAQPLNFVIKGEQTSNFKKLIEAAKTILAK